MRVMPSRIIITSISDCLLRQITLADKIWLYPSLITIPFSLLGLLTSYSCIMIIWIPCWILSHVTSELGVYLFIIACFVHICSQVSGISSSSDFEIDGMHLILIHPDDGWVNLNDNIIQQGDAPPPQPTVQDGGDCDNGGDPQCMMRQEVDEEVV